MQKGFTKKLCKFLFQKNFKRITERFLQEITDRIPKSIYVEILKGFSENEPEKLLGLFQKTKQQRQLQRKLQKKRDDPQRLKSSKINI